MQQHLGRQDGVQKVEVSLADGKVTIYRKEDAKFDPAAIFKAVYDSGVSVSEMTIVANGDIVKDGQGVTFRSGGQSFPVKPNEISAKLDAGPVKLRGLLYKKPAGKKPKTPDTSHLEILEVIH